MGRPLVVLVTGAGAPGIRGTIYALRHNSDGVAVRIVGTDMNPHAVGRHLVDVFHRVPAPESADYLEELGGVCSREPVDVVLPQTTREISVLSAAAETLGSRTGARVICSSARAIARANNKCAVLEVFRRMGLPHPQYALTGGEREFVEAVRSFGYPSRPVVVKPPVSNGMRGFRVLTASPWSLERFLSQKPSGTDTDLEHLLPILRNGDHWPELLVTEYLSGPEYSVDAFASGPIAIAVPRRRDAIRSGISFENAMVPRNDLAEFTLAAAREIGLEYAFGFQYKEDESGVPKVLECNPRVQGTMVASVFAGVNPVWLSIKASCHWPIRPEETQAREASFFRYWGGLGVVGDAAFEI
jgi:carbamoyl-phosphate synthase large subunit